MAKKQFPKGIVLKLPKVRLSYPDVWEPKSAGKDNSGKPSAPKFQASFLLDPTDKVLHKPTLLSIKAEQDRLISLQWPAGRPHRFQLECWGKGENRRYRDSGEVYSGYAGMYFVNAKSKADRPPLIVDRNKIALPKDSPQVYAGVYCNATVNFYIQDDDNGQALRMGLRAIQVLGYGEAFGETFDESEFDDFEDASGDDEFGGDDDGLD